MTTAELAIYYANLLIVQYIGQPNAYATVLAQVTPVLMDQMPLAVQNGFNIKSTLGRTAIGAQLDMIGEYVGITRVQYSPIQVTLDDADYLILLLMTIIKNNSGSSLATIQTLLAQFFPGQAYVGDTGNMTLSYVLLTSLGSTALLDVLQQPGILPAPMGVGVSVSIVSSLAKNFFGLRTYSASTTLSPLNSYAYVNPQSPWLNYEGT
jgi:hypothetical protein